MPFLELKNIGKIYVSEGNVAVGIRGVDLAFDKGEFVAVTGESGSGKSTLLNVISGMDSYEEGELLIEGRPTSHFLEPERERYREEYISFIFQDYNILDSFTVLQNVELALLSIEDPVKRRARAVELLNRVGLGDKLRQRGSKLSGGQKQRTVIARALAKDSPVILADEPTGNLDSESAKEIMALLKEVSKERLLIVVTHNIDEVAGYATREVRIFDGAVVSDTRIAPAEAAVPAAPSDEAAEPARAPKAAKSHTIRNGLALGRAMFSATPKLSIFLCLLMLLGSLGLLAITGRCGKIPELLGTPTMFAPTEGRLVVTKSDGTPLSDKEVDRLADDTGAVRTLHYDYLLDAFRGDFETNTYLSERDEYYSLQPVYGKHFKEKIYGREPREENEALLYLPVSWKPVFGSGDNFVRRIAWCGLEFDVVGVQYFLDNNQCAKILLTEDGFACAMAAMLLDDAEVSVTLGFMKNGRMNSFQTLDTVLPSFEMPKNSVYVSSKAWNEALDARTEAGSVPVAQVSLSAYFRINNSFLSEFIGGRQQAFRAGDSFEGDIYLRKAPEGMGEHSAAYAHERAFLAVNADVLRLAAEQQLAAMYPQASLFYTGEAKAQAAAEKLRADGYVSALSTAKYSPEVYETVLSSAQGIMLLVMWVLTVIFLAFFINLCSGKAVGAFRHDLAILRSMGIPVKIVVSGLFARLFLSLIPSVIFVMLLAFVLYRTPAFNAAFPYLYWWQYLLIFLGMALMAARVGYKQVKKLFGRSVRETLRGGDDI
ncbi:MAG: ABC transporter ATP-binding protein [Lachnospiraceae bacterium]|nr:ABC transporter ATP-binding protein [Lachnospiraceae bacterium]